MKDINIDQFKVTQPIKISEVNTSISLDADKKEKKKALKKTRKKLAKWQDKLYAHGKYSVLVCLQGMDTSGKDSLIREVFQGFNSRGVVVHSFKTPSKRELRHNYLWRHYVALPERGKFGVFNRTQYENVLVTRVHPEYILGENIPHINSLEDIDEDFWETRMNEIRDFEEGMVDNGTIVFKFFLHISKEEQKYRLLRRLQRPEKNWKFSPSDLEERKLWEEYQNCYEKAINNTSTEKAPWYIIPSDDKKAARYLVAKILREKLLEYEDVQEPSVSPEVEKNIDEYIAALKEE
ncbi:polyphosphate kinase 2 family protein [Mesonia sp. MT50]|uniref:Polyphosphate kinase 2 family protein n=1 Tax=Mesonia profundi TaxID=3070998 RepID=A0ABU1A056_9FLAO|nr:PPK2 family polyphosphate kinase [Mesonia profundi]MDQ7917073.1 polyphosphate kinase 2 family protein [Mesonia profundi]